MDLGGVKHMLYKNECNNHYDWTDLQYHIFYQRIKYQRNYVNEN